MNSRGSGERQRRHRTLLPAGMRPGRSHRPPHWRSTAVQSRGCPGSSDTVRGRTGRLHYLSVEQNSGYIGFGSSWLYCTYTSLRLFLRFFDPLLISVSPTLPSTYFSWESLQLLQTFRQ